MKILFVSAYDAPRGHSARTYNFAREMVLLGHEVTIITNGFNHFSRKEYLHQNEKFRIEIIDGIRVLWLKTFPYHSNGVPRFLNMLSNAWQAYFRSNLLQQSPDIVVGPSVPLFTALSAYLIAKKMNAKFIFEIRDVWPEALIVLGYLSKKSVLSYLFKKIEVFLYKKSSYIVTSLPYVYNYISEYGVSIDKISYIPNGVYLKPFKQSIRNERKSNEILTIKWIGNFSAAQGTSLLLDCAKKLKNKPVKFVLIGAKECDIKKISSTLTNYKNIIVRPVITKNDVPNELLDSDILIAIFKDTGVFKFGMNSNKVYDYLAAGKPIIFSGNAPNNQILEAGAGVAIPPDNIDALYNAILEMLKMSRKEREEMGRKGREYAEENLDVKDLSKKLIGIFESVVKEK